MNHKTFVLAGLGSFSLLPALGQTAQSQPNVIFLVADDLGYGDLSCYGATRVETPNVDGLAQHGVRFTDAHAVASTSTPSRYSMLTGEYCFRRPGTDIATGDAGMIIRPEQYTLADMFKSCGYTTGAVGKWHLGLGSKTGKQNWNEKLDMGLDDIGFDYYCVMAATADRVPCVYIENGVVKYYDSSAPISVSYSKNFAGEPTGKDNPELLTKLKSSHGHNQAIVNGIGRIGYMKGGGKALWRDEDIADSIAASAIRFIERNADNPFFLYLCTNDVHVPRYPHERFRGKSVMGLRGEAIMQFDYTVGQVMETLRRLNLDENTLIVITSDNGPVLDDGYQDQARELAGDHKPGGPWRGGKYSAFEAGTAVPFIVNWPAAIKQGKVSDALVSHIDLVASMAQLVGAQLPLGAAPDSRDQLETWLGRSDEPAPFVAEMAQDHTVSVRTSQWKYIEPSNGAAKQGQTGIETGYSKKPQLYDISISRYETENLIEAQPEVAKQFSQHLDELRQPKTSADTCFWYRLLTPQRESRCATSTGVGNGLIGKTEAMGADSQWKFVKRPEGDGYDIVNREDKSYLTPCAVQRPALQLHTSAERPAEGWVLKTNGIMNCLFSVTCGTSQMNQSEKSRNYQILNWGNGTNTTDVGCLYAAVLTDATVEGIVEGIETVKTDPSKLEVKNGRFVWNGNDKDVELYEITGKRCSQGKMPTEGIYIVRSGKKAWKIAL